jgi:hypothetical protein
MKCYLERSDAVEERKKLLRIERGWQNRRVCIENGGRVNDMGFVWG